jgi:hypothetical protein
MKSDKASNERKAMNIRNQLIEEEKGIFGLGCGVPGCLLPLIGLITAMVVGVASLLS